MNSFNKIKSKYKFHINLFFFTDEAQEAEAIQVLNAIYDMREHQSNRKPQDLALVCHALAMLYFILYDIQKVFVNQSATCLNSFSRSGLGIPVKGPISNLKLTIPPPKNLIEEIPKIVVSNFVKKYRSYDADFVSMLSETPIYMSIEKSECSVNCGL